MLPNNVAELHYFCPQLPLGDTTEAVFHVLNNFIIIFADDIICILVIS